MNKSIYHIAPFLFILVPFFSSGQEPVTLVSGLSANHISHSDSASPLTTPPLDTAAKISTLKRSLQHRIDSLNPKGTLSSSLQQKLDSLNNDSTLLQEKYQKLLALEQKIKDHITPEVPGLDTLSFLGNRVEDKVSNIQSVSSELGVGPLGEDLQSKINPTMPDIDVPNLPTDIGARNSIPDLETPDIASNLPSTNVTGLDLKDPTAQLPDEMGGLQTQASKITEVVKQAGDLAKNADEYGKEIKTIKEEGLTRSEKIPDLAERQLAEIEEVKAMQAEIAPAINKEEEYRKLIEQYKDEKRIEAELKEKARDQATDLFVKNKGKVDDTMKKIMKYSRKFPQVQDMRELPKRVPNPLKQLSWRERFVPGLAVSTFTYNTSWLEIDPQVYYRIHSRWSAGVGGMYRFSVDPKKVAFDDFNNLKGGKAFVQYRAFKSFFLQAEGQFVSWKPWDMKSIDPDFTEQTYVAAAGIGKSFNITRKLKGNATTLYHHHWNGSDPYRSKVLIRIGIDFSLKKKEVKPWELKAKELKKVESRAKREMRGQSRKVMNPQSNIPRTSSSVEVVVPK